MQEIIIKNQSNPFPGAFRAQICKSFFCRLRGLTFRRHLPPNWGLLLVQNRDNRMDSAIHMLGMWLDLLIVWINHDMEVVDVRVARRWRSFIVPHKPARYVLETAVENNGFFQVGDEIAFENQITP